MNVIFDNITDKPVLWVNSSEETIVIIVYNKKGSPIRASRLSPQQSFSVPPGHFLERIS